MSSRRNARGRDKTASGELAYQQALGRARSIAGALNLKRKRKRVNQELKALREENFEAWMAVHKRKRIIARPMSRVKRAHTVLRKCKRVFAPAAQQTTEVVEVPLSVVQSVNEALDQLTEALNDLKDGIGPMAMAMKQCTLKQQDLETRMEQTTMRGNDLNRALMKGCQEIFNSDQVWLYANSDFANEILPTSMYHLRTWTINKRIRKLREAAGVSTGGDSSVRGNTSGNAPSTKPIGKSQTNAKRSANKERQDMGNSMVDHVPVCVADPTSYMGLAGVVPAGQNDDFDDDDEDDEDDEDL